MLRISDLSEGGLGFEGSFSDGSKEPSEGDFGLTMSRPRDIEVGGRGREATKMDVLCIAGQT